MGLKLKYFVLLLATVALIGCSVTDEQWDAFCEDGHCPIAKLGKAANEDQRERDAREGRMPSMPAIPPMRSLP